MHLDADPRANVIHLLVSLALQRNAAYRTTQKPGEPSTHSLDVGPQLRAFADYGNIDIAEPPSGGRDFGDDGLKQLRGVCAQPFLVGIREMRADISKCRCTKKSVDNGMQDDICVGMALEPNFAGNLDSAQNEPAPRLEAVRVVAKAYAKPYHRCILYHFTAAYRNST